MQTAQLWAISPLDGRYHDALGNFGQRVGEAALIQRRLEVEIRWILWLDDRLSGALFPPLEPRERSSLEKRALSISPESLLRIKTIEAEIHHDVKAIELFLRETTARETYGPRIAPYWHFACTSEDINNLAYALIWRTSQDEFLLPALATIQEWLGVEARISARTPMLSRTHGQPASPTTMGKELANFAYRLGRAHQSLKRFHFSGKFNGAVGNYNAHVFVLPDVDWIALSRDFVSSFGLDFNPLTTQIEPHDRLAEWLDLVSRTNAILLDLCRDLWGYIAMGYFHQRAVSGEVGSSTMPHKINPIWFENAEGNLGLANAVLRHLAEKLPISRFQRDLSDSTAQRNVGVGIGYTVLSWHMIREGLSRITVHREALQHDLDRHLEVLGEAIQTLLRRSGHTDAYERIKDLTRGRNLDSDTLTTWLHESGLPPEIQQQIEHLKPAGYIGLATELTEKLDDFLKQPNRED
ncbi:MAG: adenylosuccinate lyase [Gammaproteobacteria bacterium]